MSRTALHRQAEAHSGYPNAPFIKWTNGTDLTLRGYKLHPTKRVRVEVPIFQHAFYPKLDHTELDIRQNITYRMIELPSVHELRMHGIDCEKAAVIAEVSVHPRHIKNNNYFRTDFPAVAKQIAKVDDTVLIFPANDMPTARFKRKFVLAFWRQAFTPLFIKNKLYTSGRISMYFAAPPGATKNLSRSLNLESKDETVRDPVNEWYPTHSKRAVARKRGTRKPKARFTPRQERIATDVLKDTSIALQRDVMPVLRGKLEISQHSKEAQEIEDWLGQPATGRELLRRTKRGGKGAVRTWVNQVMMPRVKEILKDEMGAAADATTRWVIREMLRAVVSMVLDSVKTSRVGKSKGWTGRALQKFEIGPGSNPLDLGAASLRYKSKTKVPGSEREQKRRIIEKLRSMFHEATGDYGVSVEQVFDVKINPNADKAIVLTMNQESIKQAVRHNPETMGKFAIHGIDGKPKANIGYYRDFVSRLLPDMRRELDDWYRDGMPSTYEEY